MKTKIRDIVYSLCILSFMLTGCVQKIDGSTTDKPEISKYFDFNVNQDITLSIDYCFTQKDYIVLFEIYDQCPVITNKDGETVKKDIEPIYRAATDGSGKFTATIPVLATFAKVWLYSAYTGTMSPVELEIANGKVTFNQNDYIKSLRQQATKAVTKNNYKYPDGWATLGDWNASGTPEYLDAERKMPSANLLYSIKKIYVDFSKESLQNRYPEFFQSGVNSSVKIIKPTKVYLTFIASTASWKNSVGYFVYPTGEEPKTVADVQQILAFPSATQLSDKGALVSGDRVLLKYWDGKKYVDEFPAGISIGWWLEGMAFGGNNGNIVMSGNDNTRFSLDHLNTDGVRRTVALGDPKSGKIVALGFEDNRDSRYNDATFYLEVTEDGAISGDIPVIPDGGQPSDNENYVIKYGTLLFEDLWPSSGDYDMNDVMVKYNSKIYKNVLNNYIYKIVDEYTPYHSGGSLQSGFGIHYPYLTAGNIRSVKIEGNVTPSKYMEGALLEPGQAHPTIILFDNIRTVVNKPITVTIEFNDVPEASVITPYNPFIIPMSDMARGREVHLVKYEPTDKIDKTLLGAGDDGSRPDEGLYYVLNKLDKQYPFALNLSSISNMPVPNEGAHIDITYPEFRIWVDSDGKTNKDWYLKPAK